YCSIAALIEVYNIGQVWVNILHNVYATLVSELRWSDTAKTDRTGMARNIIHLHLCMLVLQPYIPPYNLCVRPRICLFPPSQYIARPRYCLNLTCADV
ncbi:hypothetical protein EV421DRAFT_1719843, partial [Armillaria borealis]